MFPNTPLIHAGIRSNSRPVNASSRVRHGELAQSMGKHLRNRKEEQAYALAGRGDVYLFESRAEIAAEQHNASCMHG